MLRMPVIHKPCDDGQGVSRRAEVVDEWYAHVEVSVAEAGGCGEIWGKTNGGKR